MGALKQTSANPTQILIVGADGAARMMGALRAVLETCDGRQFQCSELLLQGSGTDMQAGLRCHFARHAPGLLVVCVEQDLPPEMEAVLEEILSGSGVPPVLLALNGVSEEWLSGLLQMGVMDFIVAPFRRCDLLPRLGRLRSNPNDGNASVSDLKLKLGLRHLIGESPELAAAIKQIPKFARCEATVLLNGETGTGKEMFARAIHYLSPRTANAFIPVNCGAIPAELVENELFGHEPGAFTGAAAAARGLIFEAEGGTLFLDEIDALPLPTQVKLLRFLQDHGYRPLGARKLCGANIRIIAAANVKLENSVRAGKFRADLFYRINVLSLVLPPLRERKQDIPLLARHFVRECAREMNLPPKEISAAALHKLMSYHWPGNVRELQNVLQRASVLVEDSVIRPMDIELPGQTRLTEVPSFKALKAQVIEDFERSYLEQLLSENEGNITRAARAADKNRRALWELLRKHHIQLPHATEDWKSPVDKPRLH